jgi:hypothetical protein
MGSRVGLYVGRVERSPFGGVICMGRNEASAGECAFVPFCN